MRKFLLAFSLLIVLAPVIAQQKKKITHEDLWLMKRVGAPEISPDGKWVVFNVTEPSYTETETVNDLWIVPADGSAAPRRLTSGKSAEGGYQWSPDGKYIAFSAKREGDEAGQIYLLNVKEGGEAERFTNISTGAGSPKWSPDGKMLLFNSSVFPGAYADSTNKKIAEERKKIKYKARVYTQYPIRNWDRWLDDKQPHMFVQAIGSDKATNLLTDVAVSKQEGFFFGGAAWAPDSRTVVFTATTEAGTGAYQETKANLYAVSVNGGDAKQLTTDGHSYGAPQFSPDGKFLFTESGVVNNNKVYNLDRLTRFDWPSMQHKTILAKEMDRPVNSYTIVGNTIYLISESEGRDMVYTMPVSGGNPQILTKGGVGSYTGLSVSDNGVVVASFESSGIVKSATDHNETERYLGISLFHLSINKIY